MIIVLKFMAQLRHVYGTVGQCAWIQSSLSS